MLVRPVPAHPASRAQIARVEIRSRVIRPPSAVTNPARSLLGRWADGAPRTLAGHRSYTRRAGARSRGCSHLDADDLIADDREADLVAGRERAAEDRLRAVPPG